MFEQSVVDQDVPSRVRVEINLNTIAGNAAEIKRRVGKNCRLVAVMKANAYGLGVKPLARFLVEKGDIAGFGVAEMKEALELLEFGLPIQVLGNLLPYEVEFAVRHELMIPLVSLEMAQIISREAERQHKVAHCHIAIDSGMGRL
ncbi:MAG: alanine racemase, partial [Victivallaceae bacterium]